VFYFVYVSVFKTVKNQLFKRMQCEMIMYGVVSKILNLVISCE
jgi:hypothetical protein